MISRATYRQILASSSILLCSFIYGCKVGFSQALTWMCLSSNSELKATETDISWIVAVSYTGTLLSLIVCYMFGNEIGRRKFICGTILVYIVAWTLIAATTSVTVIIVCMFLYGLASSILVTMGSVYFGEITSPRNREILGVFYPVMSVLGSQVEFLLASLGRYRLLALFPLVVCALALLLWTFMVESPCYLVAAGEHEEAIRNLRWLHEGAQEDDLDEMYDSVVKYVDERQSKGFNKIKIILYPDNCRLIVTMVVIQCAATINCRTIVMLYGSVVTKMFARTVEETTFVNLYSAGLTLSTIVGFPNMMYFSRKRLLVVGFVATALMQVACAYFYYVEQRHGNQLEWLAVVIVALLILHGFVSTSTYSPAISVLKGEVFPFSVKEVCGSMLSLTNDCAAFVTSKFYFALATTIGLPFLFLVYAFFTAVGLVAVCCNINDTKGKTLHQIRSDYMCEEAANGGQQLHHLRNNYKIVKTQADV